MSSRSEGDDRSDSVAVLLSADSRPLRRVLRPLVWVTLEEVALDAVAEGGRLVARTSARQIADRLGLDPTTVAKALQVLRNRGLVALEREKGPAGRFGLSVYALGPVTGLTVVSPCAADPCAVSPPVVGPVVAEPAMVTPYSGQPDEDASTGAASDAHRACMDLPDTDGSDVVPRDTADATPGPLGGAWRDDSAGRVHSRPGTPLSQCLGQTALDLGRESS
ncbi:MAG: winged helix-turn-helix transcriptional regulator [Acidobacteriota bacterium]|nr:winged helix-turn-helix transcriptional regulator [Acidobacteriota bacterium]